MLFPLATAPQVTWQGMQFTQLAACTSDTNARVHAEVEWNVRLRQCCASTSCACCGFGRPMDDDTRRLIDELCTYAGMIMEDASMLALTFGKVETEGQDEVLRQLLIASDQIRFLLAGVVALYSQD